MEKIQFDLRLRLFGESNAKHQINNSHDLILIRSLFLEETRKAAQATTRQAI